MEVSMDLLYVQHELTLLKPGQTLMVEILGPDLGGGRRVAVGRLWLSKQNTVQQPTGPVALDHIRARYLKAPPAKLREEDFPLNLEERRHMWPAHVPHAIMEMDRIYRAGTKEYLGEDNRFTVRYVEVEDYRKEAS